MKITGQPQLNTKIQEGNLMRDFGKRKKVIYKKETVRRRRRKQNAEDRTRKRRSKVVACEDTDPRDVMQEECG